MKDCKSYSSQDKWIAAIVIGLLALLFMSPFMYSAVNSVSSSFGLVITDKSGCANMAGLVLNVLMFTLVVRLLMN